MLLSKLVRAIDHPYIKGKGGRLMNNARKGMQVNNSISQDLFQFSKVPFLLNRNTGHRHGLAEAPRGHPAPLRHLWRRHDLDQCFCKCLSIAINCVDDDNVWLGGEEVCLRQWHQLGEDEGLGGKIGQDKNMSKSSQGRGVLPRAAEVDQRGLGGARRPQDQAQLQGLVLSAAQEDQRNDFRGGSSIFW